MGVVYCLLVGDKPEEMWRTSDYTREKCVECMKGVFTHRIERYIHTPIKCVTHSNTDNTYSVYSSVSKLVMNLILK